MDICQLLSPFNKLAPNLVSSLKSCLTFLSMGTSVQEFDGHVWDGFSLLHYVRGLDWEECKTGQHDSGFGIIRDTITPIYKGWCGCWLTHAWSFLGAHFELPPSMAARFQEIAPLKTRCLIVFCSNRSHRVLLPWWPSAGQGKNKCHPNWKKGEDVESPFSQFNGKYDDWYIWKNSGDLKGP